MNGARRQLEFDFVSPWLAGATEEELQLSGQAEQLFSAREQMIVLKKLAAELKRPRLLEADNSERELEELKILIGSAAWKKSQSQWRRRMRRNPSKVRKVILCMRALYELSATKNQK